MKRQIASIGWVFVAGILSMVFSTVVYAQLGKGVVTGTVTDPTDAVVPEASVTLVNEATGVERASQTNSMGIYRFDFIEPGSYTLRLSAKGFADYEITKLIVTVAQTVATDVQLELAKVAAQTVTVEATGAQLVQPASSEVSGLIDRNTLAALPLEVRDPAAFVNLLPGSVPSSIGNQEFNGSTRGSSVNGARGGMGNFLIDGFDNNDQGQGGRGHNSAGSIPGAITGISPDAIQEFRVVTNSFSAQYGRQGGFVADAAMRSGTNDIHGSLFEYNRNKAITANDFFSNRTGTRDSLVRNQFGGSLGGPIRKDKTFVFGSLEFQRLRQNVPNVLTSVTPDFIDFVRSGQFGVFHETAAGGYCNVVLGAPCSDAFSNSRTLGPIASKLTQKFPFPVPTSNFTKTSGGFVFGGFDYPVNIFGDSDVRNKTTFNENRFSIKLDHNIGSNDRFTGLMAFDDFDTIDSSLGTEDGTGSPHFPLTATSRSQNWGLTHTHIFSANVVNESKVSYLRFNSGFPRNVAPEVPSIASAFDSLTVGIGMGSSLPQNFTDNQFQYQNHLAITRGRHSFKMGGEYRRARNGSVFGAERDGFFLPYDVENLLTDGSFGADADALEGARNGGFFVAEASVNPITGLKPEYYRGFRANEFGTYIQDDWRVHPRLTLNLGLRWDYFGPPHNFRRGLDSNFYFGNGILPLTPPSSATLAPNPFFPAGSVEYAREANALFLQRDHSIWNQDTNNFSPRFGFAWDVHGDQTIVLRGGAGVFYDRFWNNLFENIRFNPPFFSFNQIGALINGFPVSPTAAPGLYAIPIDTALFNNPVLQGVPSPRHMDENMVAPYMEQVFFGVQRQLTSNSALEINYIGTFGHKLTGVVDLNTFPGRALPSSVRDPVTGLPFSSTCPNPTIGRDNARANFYNSNYNALQVQVTKHMSHGLQFQSNYTWSKALDYMSDPFNNRASGGVGFIRPMDTLNRRLDYGSADFDLRHRFVTSFLYDLPLLRENSLFGGWTMGSIITLQRGLPFTVFNGGVDYNRDGNLTDRPDYVGSVHVGDAIDRFRSPADGYFKTDGFSAPILDPSVNLGLWRNGRLGRNVLSGPGLAVVDFSLGKKFRLTETAALQLQFNFFNLFNQANFVLPEGSMASNQFGRSTATFGPRVGQFAARLDF